MTEHPNTAATRPPRATAVPAALPPDAPERRALHDEVHARPPARIRLPALVVYVAVLNEGITREDECSHLRRLPGQDGLRPDDLQASFLRLRFGEATLKWERHTEFTRYSIVQPLPPHAGLGAEDPPLLDSLEVDPAWLAAIPGRTVAAIKLAMVHGDLADPQAALAQGQRWFGGGGIVASLMGGGHSCAITDFRLRDSGFERLLVIAPPQTSVTRAGRISARLLELETYRMMALRGLPAAKSLTPVLGGAETALAGITSRIEAKQDDDEALLDRLVGLAAQVERATAEHAYRFAATAAYAAIVEERIGELRERPIPGTQTIGEFMRRRLSPAIATVAATEKRLGSLAQRVERCGGLLRTRVDIATEAQNSQLLEKLTRGQAMQLRLQSTVEGLSIAAISYYVISLLLYGAKSAKAAGLPLNPELAVGLLIPLVLWVTWRTTRRLHHRLEAMERGAEGAR
ncbi:DUF3422 family protein [Piscinibacter sakaiensis]|uniref:Membrane-anchored protein n=1 Tax=Piscinibacter sakaiensis TaxID=1547922 RepID=A0A0K8NVD8_PISS1|nr:DUF3422 domain-containing protein [Piscinibacter sakaiensis]GAP33905.1 hypothetical protein ISF6_1683 [Piscinibacter sakaiensis]